jgi:hypothetical protein
VSAGDKTNEDQFRELRVNSEKQWHGGRPSFSPMEGRETPASTGFRVVGQREMNDYLDTGNMRSMTGQIHVAKDPDSSYAIREDQTGLDPSYILEVDLTQDRWDYKDYAQRQGAVHRRAELPMDRVKSIYGFRNSTDMGKALE